MPCRTTQDEQVIVKSSDKTWCTGGGNGNPLHYSCLENPMDSMKRQKCMTMEDEPPRSEGVQYTTGEEQRAVTNSSRKNEEAGPKWKWYSVVDVSGGESKVWCCKEQYCIGTWRVRYMNQDKLDVVKQEMARVNINILGISELKWMRISSVQSLSNVQRFETPWTAACQALLSITNSQSLLKLMSIGSVMLSHSLILCHPFSFCPQSFPASGSFPMSRLFTSGGHCPEAEALIRS